MCSDEKVLSLRWNYSPRGHLLVIMKEMTLKWSPALLALTQYLRGHRQVPWLRFSWNHEQTFLGTAAPLPVLSKALRSLCSSRKLSQALRASLRFHQALLAGLTRAMSHLCHCPVGHVLHVKLHVLRVFMQHLRSMQGDAMTPPDFNAYGTEELTACWSLVGLIQPWID